MRHFGNSDVFRVTGRLSNSLLASSPGDGTGLAEEKAICSNGPASIGATGMACIREASKAGRVFATESQLEFTSALEVTEDTFASIPVSLVKEGKELAELANSESDIWACGNSEIHEESYQATIGELGQFKLLLTRERSVRMAGEYEASFHRSRYGIAAEHVELFENFIDEGCLR